MTPTQLKQKKRIEDAKKALNEALWAHKCTIPRMKKDKYGEYGLAVCPVCRHCFGWYCPKSKNRLCNYDPPGNPDNCNYCHQPDERK